MGLGYILDGMAVLEDEWTTNGQPHVRSKDQVDLVVVVASCRNDIGFWPESNITRWRTSNRLGSGYMNQSMDL